MNYQILRPPIPQKINLQNASEPEQSFQSNQPSPAPCYLQESRENAHNFIKQLGQKALTPISQCVLEHYNGTIRPYYQVTDIFNFIDKRIAKMIRNKKIKKNWNTEDIILLVWFVSKYLSLKQNISCQSLSTQDWQFISKLIPGSSPKGCMFKFISLKKVKLSVCSWSHKEQEILRQLVHKFGKNKWKQISQSLYENKPSPKIFRTPKQCRQHWNCYLDPNLKKGPWSEAEDIKLLNKVKQNKGQKKWSLIKNFFQGRTENALKNRYNLLIERQKKISPHKSQTQLVFQYLKAKAISDLVHEHSSQLIKDEQKSLQNLIQKGRQKFQEAKKQLIENQRKKSLGEQFSIKSEKSSFRLSEAYRKKLGINNQIKQQEMSSYKTQSTYPFYAKFGTIASIHTNQQGFYTKVICRPLLEP